MNEYFVSHGSHHSRADGMCAMEWVAYLAGEEHSDSPECVCLTLKRFCVAFNDGLPDDQRQELRPYLARTIGTRGDGLADRRAWMCLDWLIRVHAPVWLSLAGLDDAAGRLRLLPPVLAVENLERAMGDLRAAKREADAAGDAARDAAWAAARAAAWDAAGDAARDATGDAAWDAAWAAVWDATGDAARDAAWAAARDATGDAAGDAARDAAWAAAWDAARDAARDATGDAARAAARAAAWDATWAAARAAARDAARTVLQPTVEELQRSAFDLLDRMLPTEPIQLPAVDDADRICTFA